MRLKSEVHWSVRRQVEPELDCENASRVRRESAKPDWTRRFIRSLLRMQSSRRTGSHHRSSRRCRIRGDPKTQGRQSRKVREPRQLGEPSADAEGARIRGNPETQTQGKAGRCKERGNSQPHREAQLEERSRGAT